MTDDLVNVRYMVGDVRESIDLVRGRQILPEDPSGNPVELFEPSNRR